jgi:hypothetical protein
MYNQVGAINPYSIIVSSGTEMLATLIAEGELISNVQGVGSVEYDIDEYVGRMERIVARNIEIYGDLQRRLTKFKKHLKEEEEAH